MTGTYVQLSGTFTSPSGAPASGRVGWHASNFAVQTGTGLVICPVGSSVGLDSTGSFSIPLLATDVNGVAFFYTLVIELAYTWLQGSPTPPAGSGVWSFFLPAANGLTQNFSDLAFVSLPSPLSPGGAPPVFNPPLGGVTVTGTPTSGEVLTATSGSAANWEQPASGAGVTLDTTDIPAALASSGSPGSIGQASDSGHVHPLTGVATSTALSTETSRAEAAEAGKLSTSGTAAAASAITSATTTVNTSNATAPSSGQVLTATSPSAAAWVAPSGGLAAGQVQSAWAAGIR